MAKKTYNAVKEFREKCEIAMARVKDIEAFKESDPMVKYIFEIGHSLFDTPLDVQAPDMLIRTGGKLTGAYAYLGQKAARSRAERDVYEQKADEVQKEIVLAHVKDKQYKVTEAKAMASAEMIELNELVIVKEAEKNQYESITEAAHTMIMFIQSALRTKENERYSSSRSHNNG